MTGGTGLKPLSAKTIRTMTQLAKEFWLPLVVAIAWTVLSVWHEVVDTKSVVSSFGAAFFFVSWMTGQIFRVRKQAGVESSLLAVESRIQAVTEHLETQTKELLGHVTGGASFCYVQVGRQGGNSTLWLLIHGGGSTYPMYSVSATIVDVDSLSEDLRLGREFERNFDIGEVSPGVARTLDWFDLGYGSSRNFNVFLYARNGSSTQRVRFRRVSGEWRWATQVVNRRGDILHTQIDEDYPRNAGGAVDWD
jgi:hypothetical protein